MERDERYRELMGQVNKLPVQRTVVIRAYLGGQLRQIGEELNTPIGTIKSALSRALVACERRTRRGVGVMKFRTTVRTSWKYELLELAILDVEGTSTRRNASVETRC